MTATRRASYVIIMQACDIFLQTNGENYLKVCSLFNYMLHILHKMPYDRRKAYRLYQMTKHSFQHTALILNPQKPSKTFKTQHISKFTCSWVKHYCGLTRVNTDVKYLHAWIVYVIVTSRTLTPISSCSRVFCNKFSFHFWHVKGRFRSGLASNNHHASKGQDAILNLSKYQQVAGHILAFVPPPKYIHRDNGATLNNETNLSGRGIWENLFNPGLMHKLIA